MNHGSGFIIVIAMIFTKILIEHTPKSHLKKHPSALTFFFTMIIGPLVSIKKKKALYEYHPTLKFAILFLFIFILLFFHRHNSLQKWSLGIKVARLVE